MYFGDSSEKRSGIALESPLASGSKFTGVDKSAPHSTRPSDYRERTDQRERVLTEALYSRSEYVPVLG